MALLAYGITAVLLPRRPQLYTACAQWGPLTPRCGSVWRSTAGAACCSSPGLTATAGRPDALGAEGISLIVGIALAVLCLIALANGHDAFGDLRRQRPDRARLGAAAALLIVLSLLPRVGGETKHGYEHSAPTGTASRVEPEHRTIRRNPARERTAGVDRQRPTTTGARAVPSLPFRTQVTNATTPPSNPANQPGGRNDRSVPGNLNQNTSIQKQGSIV